MGKPALLQVPVKWQVIFTDEHGLLYGAGDALCLPIHNGEIVHISLMSCGLAVMVDEGGGYAMFPKSIPRGPPQFPYVFFWAVC